MSKTKIVICPYCGSGQPAADRCRGCGGLFEPLSRQATLNHMGPWFVRDADRPFQPGCSYETLVRMIDRGKVTRTTIVRGPTTRQLWTVARRVSGVAHLLGYCHACDASVDPGDHACHACGAAFGAYLDRNYLGLPEIRPLPWEADLDEERRRGVAGGVRGRLSRFASDEELLDSDGSRAGVSAFAPEQVPLRGPGTAGSPASEALAEYASTSVTRALQRRIASQTRTNRVLAGLVITAVALAVLTNVGPIRRLLSPPPETARPAVPATSTEAPGPPPLEVSTTGPAEAPLPAGAAPADAAPTDAAPADAAPAEPAAGTEGAAAPDLSAEALQEAARLLAAAAQPDRTIDARIADYEGALALLQAAQQAAGGAASPDIAAKIEDARLQLERLILKRDYFDG